VINSEKYCSQLDRLKAAIDEKHSELKSCRVSYRGVVFHQDNAKPHLFDNTAKITAVWDVLPHLPYLPDIAPSDFHLFRTL